LKPLEAVSRAFNHLLGRNTKSEHEHETADPVDRVRAGINDLNKGRVHKIERASDLFDDE